VRRTGRSIWQKTLLVLTHGNLLYTLGPALVSGMPDVTSIASLSLVMLEAGLRQPMMSQQGVFRMSCGQMHRGLRLDGPVE